MTRSDTVARDAFEQWAYSELAAHYAQPCVDEVMDYLTGRSFDSLRHLADARADTAEAIVFKVFPILVAAYEPLRGEPPLLPSTSNDGPAQNMDALLVAVLDDMRRLFPEIAGVMDAPAIPSLRREDA